MVGKNTFYSVIWTGVSILASALLGPIIFHKMSVLGWSVYSFFLLCIAILIFIESSIQSYVQIESTNTAINDRPYHPFEDVNLTSFTFSIILLSVCCSLLLFYTPFREHYMGWCFLLSIVHLTPRLILAVSKGVALSQINQTRFYFLSSISNIVRSLLILAAIFMSYQISDLIKLFVFYSFIEVCFFVWYSGISFHGFSLLSTHKKETDSSRNRKLLYTILCSNLASVLCAHIDKVFAFISLKNQLAGEYTLAASVASLLYIFVNASITSHTARYIELQKNNEWGLLKENFFRTSMVNNFLAAITIAGCFIYGDYILNPVLLKLDRLSFIQNLAYLVCGIYILSNLWLPGCISNCMKKPQMALFTNLTFIISYISIISLAFYLYATGPLAMSFLLSSIITFFINFIYFKKRVMEFQMFSYLRICFALPIVVCGFLLIPMIFIASYNRVLSMILLLPYAYIAHYLFVNTNKGYTFITRLAKE